MARDIRQALRLLWKSPVFTLAAVISLALGIGANATIFSLIDGLWLRPPAVRAAGELVHVFHVTERSAFGNFSWPEYEHFRDNASSLAGVVACGRRGGIQFTDAGLQVLSVNVVSPNFFTALGIRAEAGRVFRPEDDFSAPVAVLGYGFWQRRYGGDPGIIGRSIQVSKANFTVIGVAERRFRDLRTASDIDLWLPPQSWLGRGDFARRSYRWMEVHGVVRRGVSIDTANREFQMLASRLEQQFPESSRGMRIAVWPDLRYRMHGAGATGAALTGIVILVVLISCVNIANLLLSRAEARRREIGIRLAIGATRWQVVRQLLAESMVLAAAGAALALLLAAWLINLLPGLFMAEPDAGSASLLLRLDLRVLLFTLGLTAATGVLFGLAPAIETARTDLVSALKAERFRFLPRHLALRDITAVVQLALSLFLLVGAGVLVKSFVKTQTDHIGFGRKNLLVVSLGAPFDEAKSRQMQAEAVELMSRLPGVKHASYATRAPLSGPGSGMFLPVTIPGYTMPPGVEHLEIKYNRVSPGFFETMGTRLLKGRDFQASDSPDAPKVAVVNEHMARRFWPGEGPIGKFIETGTKKEARQIVGIVEDAPIAAVGELAQPYFYLPVAQAHHWEFTLLVETPGDPLLVAGTVRRQLRALHEDLNPWTITTLREMIRRSTMRFRMTAALVGALGLLGFLLTGVGLYGVLSYGVASRMREIGVRMALGAQRGQTLLLVLGRGTRLGLTGVGIGLPLSLIGARVLPVLLERAGPGVHSALFRVSASDPGALVAAVLMVLAVTLVAGFWPARRASRIDPIQVLREE